MGIADYGKNTVKRYNFQVTATLATSQRAIKTRRIEDYGIILIGAERNRINLKPLLQQ